MSVARPIYKGVTLMLTRRIRGRVYLLRASKRTNQIIGYVLAVISKKYGIEIHAYDVLSNHWHVVLTDPNGKIVDFQRDCHSFIARGLNDRYDDSESIWASAPSSRVECEQPEDVIDKIAYTMANPVESFLVRNGKNWPGLRRAWPAKPVAFKRPPRFFRGPEEGGEWPDEAVLVMARPPGYEELSDDELGDLVRSAIEEREDTFRRIRDDSKQRFLGRRKILDQSRYGSSKSPEEKSGISPKVACKDRWRRVERLAANKAWGESYRVALVRWRRGDRDVEFPAGTYLMCVVHGANCARAPD